jgi:hypothetical protein
VLTARILSESAIGRRLEDILEAAEAAFLQTLATRTRPALDEARAALEAGDMGPFQKLTTAQQVLLLREVRSGVIPVKPGTRFLLQDEPLVGGRVALTMKDPLNLGTAVVDYPRAPVARPALPRTGSFANLALSIRGFSSLLGVSQRSIMEVVASRSEGELEGRFAELFSRIKRPAAAGEAARDLLPVLKAMRVHTQALESARSFGMLPVSQVAGAVGGGAGRFLDPSTAGLGPMTPGKSASVEQLRRKELAEFPKPVRPTGRQRTAEHLRRARVVAVFRALARSAREGRIRVMPGAEGAALRALAQAFETWLRLHVSNKDPDALADARSELALQLIAMMDTFEGSAG